MDLNTYLIFVGASILLCISPGPDMIYVLARSVAQGSRFGIIAALGINFGAYTHLLAASIGLSSIIMTSATAFTVLKLCGAVYLVYIGIQAIRMNAIRVEVDSTGKEEMSLSSVFWQGYLSDVLNPKVAIFYLAFLPQFISAEDPRHFENLLALGITCNMIGLLVNILVVCAAATLSNRLRSDVRFSNWLNRSLGAIFVGLGIKLAGEKI